MDELVARLVANTGADPEAAKKAVGIILNFLQSEGPADKVAALIAQTPGADAAVAAAPEVGFGGLMGVANQLMGAGLDMGQVQSVTKELVAYAREKLGDEAVNDLVGSVPGLSSFV
jgi:hypothetical protein